ncbi:MAG: 1,2-phenylacetyl-CoA epoxidase subunit PaaD [Chthoniobacterales bacterium]
MVTDMQTSLPSLEEIWTWLDSVSDPEIPVLSVIDLGIVRKVKWIEENGSSTLVVNVTPTYSGCPAIAVIKNDIQRELQQRGINRVRIETQLSPAWTTDWMTKRGRTRLLEYGIAPPGPCARLSRSFQRQSGEGATLQHSTTPSLRPQEVEHSLSDEARAQCCQPLEVGLASEARSTTGGWRSRKHEHEAPGAQDDAICCPRCGSSDTRVVSQFGSTPCKAFYICNSCLEPFDYFKCH